jgi:hypothetical protein
MQAKIDYECKEIHVGHITMKFDIGDRDATDNMKLCIMSLMPRSETAVHLLTTTAELKTGILGKWK